LETACLAPGLTRARARRAQGKNVLRKEPMGRDIADDDVFFYNGAFTSKFYKVKVGTVSAQKETEPEKADTRHKARAPGPLAVELAVRSGLHAACGLAETELLSKLMEVLAPHLSAGHSITRKRCVAAQRFWRRLLAGWGREVLGRGWRAR
jgi:cullin 3